MKCFEQLSLVEVLDSSPIHVARVVYQRIEAVAVPDGRADQPLPVRIHRHIGLNTQAVLPEARPLPHRPFPCGGRRW